MHLSDSVCIFVVTHSVSVVTVPVIASVAMLFLVCFQQERAMREMRGERGGNAPPLQPPPAPPASMGLERPNRNQGVSIYLEYLP